MEVSTEEAPVAAAPSAAGFWRRLAAFIVDVLVLGVVGWLVAWPLFDVFARMGAYGRIFGFVVALAYFGVMNSAVFGGQTLGKRLLGVRAVGRAGALMTLPASLLRYSVLGVPFFLNGAPFDTKVLLSPVGYVLSLVVFGGILSIPYLYLFNRRGRRSLHDLAVGSSVVTAATPVALVAPAPVWRGHLLVVGVILIAAAVLPAFTRRLAQAETFQGTMAAYEAVTAEPGVQNALVTHGTAFRSGQVNVDSVGAQVRLKERRLEDAALAERFARVILNHDKQASRVSVIDITLVYGFDVGIASGWRSKSYQFLPETLTAGGGHPAGSSK